MERPTRGKGLLEKYLAAQRRRMVESLIPEHARSGRILDLGCGTGACFLMSTRFREKVGIDRNLSKKSVTEAAKCGVRLISHDLLNIDTLPLADESFHVVTMMAVIEHISREECKRLFVKAKALLVSGGLLILTTPNRWTDRLLRVLARLGIVSQEEIDEHQHMYTARDLQLLMEEAGFTSANITIGKFELGMNLWATGVKDVMEAK